MGWPFSLINSWYDTSKSSRMIKTGWAWKTENETTRLKYSWDELKRPYINLDTIEIHAHDCHCDIDGGSDNLPDTDHVIPTGPTTPLSTDHEHSEYRLLSPLTDRKTIEYIPPIPFWHSPNEQSENSLSKYQLHIVISQQLIPMYHFMNVQVIWYVTTQSLPKTLSEVHMLIYRIHFENWIRFCI